MRFYLTALRPELIYRMVRSVHAVKGFNKSRVDCVLRTKVAHTQHVMTAFRRLLLCQMGKHVVRLRDLQQLVDPKANQLRWTADMDTQVSAPSSLICVC